MEFNKIITGNALQELMKMPGGIIDCTMTSPPYWNLRDYKMEGIIWDENKTCEHEFEWKHHNDNGSVGSTSCLDKAQRKTRYEQHVITGVCRLCGAWEGQLGQEPTPELYIKHLCDIFDQVKRITKDTGTCFVNMGDTYRDNQKQMIPARFAIEMIRRGWILRNEIIWHKNSVIPESVTNRFTNDFEMIYFFTKKSTDYFFQQYKLPCRASAVERSQYGSNKRKKATSKGFNTTDPTGERTAPSDGRNMRCVWTCRTGNFHGKEHIAAYSAELCKVPIITGCPEDGVVLDPFMGSGSTAVASLQLGRRYLGIEINPDYTKSADERIRQIKEYLGL